MTKENYSRKVLELFIGSLCAGEVPALVLAEILHISPDAAYRRLGGKVELTLNEAVEVCRRVGLPALPFGACCNDDKVLFNYVPAFTETADLSKEQDIFFFEQLSEKVIREHGMVYSLISDTSLSLLLRYPSLMAFRLFLSSDQTRIATAQPSFSLDTPLPEYVRQFRMFAQLHERTDTCDFWCRQTFTKMIDEIAFYKSLGIIPPREEKVLVEEFRGMLSNFEQYAATGEKEGGGKFTLYVTPFNLTNNAHLAFVNGTLISFFELDGANCVWTDNERYCRQQKNRFEKMKNSSVIISGSNLKERKLFFEKVYRLLDGV